MLLLALPVGGQAQEYLWTNFVGKPGFAGHADGEAFSTLFTYPSSLAVGPDGAVYVAVTY